MPPSGHDEPAAAATPTRFDAKPPRPPPRPPPLLLPAGMQVESFESAPAMTSSTMALSKTLRARMPGVSCAKVERGRRSEQASGSVLFVRVAVTSDEPWATSASCNNSLRFRVRASCFTCKLSTKAGPILSGAKLEQVQDKNVGHLEGEMPTGPQDRTSLVLFYPNSALNPRRFTKTTRIAQNYCVASDHPHAPGNSRRR